MRRIKINYKFFLLVALSFILVVFLNGCGKVECEVSSDCDQRTCSTATCVDNQCKYTDVENCCGNKIKESVENGKAGNECTCPQDYGKCEGKVQKKVGSRTFDTEYLQYLCIKNECVVGVDPEEVLSKTLLDESSLNLFLLETTVTYNEPFDVTKDTFRFRLTLKDSNENLVFPVKFTKIILNDGEVFFGEKDVDVILEEVGDSVTIEVPVSYQLEEPEETRRLTYQISYEYKQKVKDQRLEDGSYSYKDVLERNDYKNRFSTKMTLVRAGTSK